MRYRFFDPGDEQLIEVSEMPAQDGIAVSLRSTGFDFDKDEVLALSIVDLDGNELFSKVVKPQNVAEWDASEASGGIVAADVEGAEELYQFEEEISELFEKASIVVAAHLPYLEAMIAQSWVTLPDFTGFHLVERFRVSHCTADYEKEAATVASLAGVEEYYGVPAASDVAGEARAIAACYRALVKEHADERAAKGEDYWTRREQRLAEEAAQNPAMSAAERAREKNLNRMNGLLWVAAAIIFVSLAIQLYQNGFNIGFSVVCCIFAGFAASRAVTNFRR